MENAEDLFEFVKEIVGPSWLLNRTNIYGFTEINNAFIARNEHKEVLIMCGNGRLSIAPYENSCVVMKLAKVFDLIDPNSIEEARAHLNTCYVDKSVPDLRLRDFSKIP